MTDDSTELPTTDAEFPEPPEAAAAAEIPPERLDLYLAVWKVAFISGYVSAGINAAHRGGIPEPVRQRMAALLDHQARHTWDNVMADPITRTMVVVEAIEHVVAGKPYNGPSAMEITVPCLHHDHDHDAGHDHPGSAS